MDPDLVTLIEGASRLGPNDFGEALAKRSGLWNMTRQFFERFELLLLPSLPVPAFAAGRGAPEGIAGTSDVGTPMPPSFALQPHLKTLTLGRTTGRRFN
jgi:hypothetical protein